MHIVSSQCIIAFSSIILFVVPSNRKLIHKLYKCQFDCNRLQSCMYFEIICFSFYAQTQTPTEKQTNRIKTHRKISIDENLLISLFNAFVGSECVYFIIDRILVLSHRLSIPRSCSKNPWLHLHFTHKKCIQCKYVWKLIDFLDNTIKIFTIHHGNLASFVVFPLCETKKNNWNTDKKNNRTNATNDKNYSSKQRKINYYYYMLFNSCCHDCESSSLDRNLSCSLSLLQFILNGKWNN